MTLPVDEKTTCAEDYKRFYEQFLVGSDKFRYAPWNFDEQFQEVHATIASSTRIDKFRCFGLWELVAQAAKLSGAILEVGVWRGGSGALIAKRARLCGIKDTVYLCDTFKGLPQSKVSSHDNMIKGGEFADTSRQLVEELVVDRMALEDVRVVEGVFPDETGDQVDARSFRLCHLDVDVYRSAQDIMAWVWDKMVIGGIIVYDDYATIGCRGINLHVNEQMPLEDRLVFYNLDGHGIVIKLK